MDPDIRTEILDALARSRAQGDQVHARLRDDEEMQAALYAASEALTQLAAALRVAGIGRPTAVSTMGGFCVSAIDHIARGLWDEPPLRPQRRGH